MANPKEQDDILFEQLKKVKRRKRRKVVLTVLILLILAGGGIFTAVNVLRARVRTQFAANTAEVIAHRVESGRISTTVSGSGSLSYTDHTKITVPEGVEIEELLVTPGQQLTAGETVATVNINSVMTALADTQSALETLDQQINSAKNDTVSSYMTSAVSGRMKRVYAQSGDNVVDVMTEHGALALLSLDGQMTVTIQAELTVGQAVTVRSLDVSYLGTVESCIAGKSVITLTDNGPVYEAAAQVLDSEQNLLGEGTLDIRSSLAITGFAGTVSQVNARENAQVWAGGTLFTLKNTSYTANYDNLLRTRSETQETLNTLITLLRTGCVTAPFNGIVTETAEEPDAAAAAVNAYLGQSGGSGIATIAPVEKVTVSIAVDETDILSLEVGQNAQVTISSLGEETYPGVVTEISSIGVSASGVTQYSAVVTLDRQPKMLSGMTASVDIQIQGVDDVVLIPADALHRTRNTAYVFTGYDEEQKQYTGMVEVQTGASNSRFVEVISGLKPGDTVYYTEKAATGFSFPMAGMPGGMGGTQGNSGGWGGQGAQGNRGGNNRPGNGG